MHRANPHLGPVCLSKIDISDGFCRMWAQANKIPKLGALSPSHKHEQPLIGLPLTLLMGWKESPPRFSAATGTVADLANNASLALARRDRPPGHRPEEMSKTPAPTDPGPTAETNYHTSTTKLPCHHSMHFRRKPVACWDVHVDDFIGLVQGNKWNR